VPASEIPLHLGEHHRVGVLDPAERLVGEHDPESERVVGGIALPQVYLVTGPELLGERGEVQPAGPAAEHRDAHGGPAPSGCRMRSTYVVLGTTVNNSIYRTAAAPRAGGPRP